MTLTIVCAMTALINLSNEPWNDVDAAHIREASIGCQKRYKDAPCLTKFIKIEPLTYRAVCGGENDKKATN